MKRKFSKKNSYTEPKRLCYNKSMPKTKTKVIVCFVSILSATAGICASNFVASQVLADAKTTFKVNIAESLSVSITTPNNSSSGAMNTFLRNTINLKVSSTNANGFTASMYTNNNTTNLINTRSSSKTLPTLTADSTRSNFPSNRWGYSLGTSDGETSAGNANSTYHPLVSTSATPITVLSSTSTASTATEDIYFGAKADATQTVGTYSGSVVISVVSGVVDDDNPITPDNPVTPSDTNTTNPSYSGAGTTKGGGTNGTTAYTTTTNNGDTTTTTTEVSDGDTTASYANPAGVTESTTSNINSGSPLAVGLAVSAAVAATSGIFFFILAKRRKDDDEEEEEEL